MQMLITFVAVVAGLILSLAVGLLAEELIFRQFLRLFFVRRSVTQMVPQAVAAKAEQKC
jgi:membrane protease YdiL (CAAX protease family)